MHSLVRRPVKTAIGFLFIGVAIGGWRIVDRELFERYPNPYGVSAHIPTIFIGFAVTMIQGVASWLYPRRARGDTRRRPGLAAAAYRLVPAGSQMREAAGERV